MKIGFRIWLLIILVLLAIITIINPKAFSGNVMVKEIQENSSAFYAGISAGEIIREINGIKIRSIDDYAKAVSMLDFPSVNFTVKTDKGTFTYESKTLDFVLANNTIVEVKGKAKEAGLEEGMKVLSINNFSLSELSFLEIKRKVEPKAKIEIITDKNKDGYVFLTTYELGIVPGTVSKLRLKTGLDLQGGARALLEPERELSPNEMSSLLETIRYRLNVYGITDVNVREVKDLMGKSYVLVELAGATPKELKELVAKQGKFEAKIGNETVFVGGRKDITFVCRNDATCAFIRECFTLANGNEACKFNFQIQLSEKAARKHAEVTAKLSENITAGRRWLNETLDLYLDDKLVERLLIDADLKGKPATSILIEGTGIGKTREEAFKNAQKEMKKLQTILITGSLPFKLNIVKLDSVSPSLGKEFIKNILIAAIAAFVAVCLVVYIRYRKPILFVPVIVTMVSEVLLILFVAALIKWNLDLASIAGIIAAIGTGVDDQIIIIDESRTGVAYSLKERIKRAFAIILGAYATTAIALIPLWWAGTGLLRGFALTTILGITIGVFITRPAFAEILRLVTKE